MTSVSEESLNISIDNKIERVGTEARKSVRCQLQQPKWDVRALNLKFSEGKKNQDGYFQAFTYWASTMSVVLYYVLSTFYLIWQLP